MEIKQHSISSIRRGGGINLQRVVGAATAALALACASSSLLPQPAHTQAPPPATGGGMMGGKHLGTPATAKATLPQPEQISSCTGCHGLNLEGRQGFSPNLTKLGVLKEYNQKTFERVMSTGVTNDGGHVEKPMPVYHFPAAVSNKIYAYLKSIKTS